METCEEIQKDSQANPKARIPPTRNGNLYSALQHQRTPLARILPTRNGNLPSHRSNSIPPIRTDPTYKEWKQSYVDWIRDLRTASTDPTYKEWKQSPMGFNHKTFLPHGSYLQGMETAQTAVEYIGNPTNARILPTRNGNALTSHGALTIWVHGSYLQGMETGYDIHKYSLFA